MDIFLRALVMGEPKCGKAHPEWATVLTPTGWKTINHLHVGDEVISSTGYPCRVTGVFPRGKRPIFRIETNDGASVYCADDHLWTVMDRNGVKRGTGWQVKSTRELAPILHRVFYLPSLSGPVQFAGKSVDYDPYLLGLLLGDGCFCGGELTFTKPDDDLLEAVRLGAESLGDSPIVHIPDDRCPYVSVPGTKSNTRKWLQGLGLLGKRSYEKTIPLEIFMAPPEDRLALLQGLLDTDGYAVTRDNAGGKASQAEFSSTSIALAEGVVELVRSLGGRARLWDVPKPRCQTGYGRPAWRVLISMPQCPFRLPRKARTWMRGGEIKRVWRQRIKSITSAGVAKCVCISVDSGDSLYVASDYVLTHNSSAIISTLPGPVRVLLTEDESAMRGPARHSPSAKHFEAVKVIGRAQTLRALQQAKQDAEAGKIKSLVLSPLHPLVDEMLEEALRETMTTNGEDGRRAHPLMTRRWVHLQNTLFSLPCHVVIEAHFMEISKDGEEKEQIGEGIVPLMPNRACRKKLAAAAADIIWMDLKIDPKTGKEERTFWLAPQGVWTYRCRNVAGVSSIPASMSEYLKLVNDQAKKEKTR